ncbi:hypothetical protein QMG61_17320 [Cryobacterium sp. PH31-AA6]|uniref:hypothetical protein n=1 Tax=Cryobacterium sp. PH31-AA6 TaxID=3046205 RepID=UPI0024BBB24C|nr:hypothetical protein [Cryobacterium sp. PH31-AA6]MDJ0325522.1 hypothetical protein [Cryobacterium sp. PH31-AA6]
MTISLAQIQGIISTTETIGAIVPAEITKAVKRAANVREAVYAMTSDRNELSTAVLAAIDAKRDPAADPEVQRITTMQALSDGVQTQVSNLADADALSALQGNVDTLIESWQEPFDKAAQEIATAAKRLGNIKLEEAAAILHQGGDAAEHWGIATRANRTIREILDAFALLAHTTGFAALTRHYIVQRMAEVTLEQWEEHQLKEQKLSAWEAHHLGLTLSLATRETLPLRIHQLSKTRDSRAATAKDRENNKGSGDWMDKYKK